MDMIRQPSRKNNTPQWYRCWACKCADVAVAGDACEFCIRRHQDEVAIRFKHRKIEIRSKLCELLDCDADELAEVLKDTIGGKL